MDYDDRGNFRPARLSPAIEQACSRFLDAVPNPRLSSLIRPVTGQAAALMEWNRYRSRKSSLILRFVNGPFSSYVTRVIGDCKVGEQLAYSFSLFGRRDRNCRALASAGSLGASAMTDRIRDDSSRDSESQTPYPSSSKTEHDETNYRDTEKPVLSREKSRCLGPLRLS